MIGLRIDGAEIQRLADEFGASRKDLQRAHSRAIQRTATTIAKEVRQGLRSELSLRNLKVLRQRLRKHVMRPISDSRFGAAYVWAGANPISAIEFKGVRQTKAGVMVAGELERGAFIQTMPSGKRLVVRRTGKKRLPLETVERDVLGSFDSVAAAGAARVEQLYFRNLEAALRGVSIFGA